MKKIYFLIFSFLVLIVQSCSPLKSSPNEEKHQMELTLHEVQTNLDDLRHDLNCFQTEIQILDSKFSNQENESQKIKNNLVDKTQNKLDSIFLRLSELESKLVAIEQKQSLEEDSLNTLSLHANETTSALTQHKNKLSELENSNFENNKKIQEVNNLKSTLKDIAKYIKATPSSAYKVKKGDSLERIAKNHKVSVEAIKELNQLDNDLIVVGQDIKIP